MKIPMPMSGEQSVLPQFVECSVILPAITGSLVDQVMLALLLVALAASPYVGRKAERTRDLGTSFSIPQPVKNLIPSGNKKNSPKVENKMIGEHLHWF